MYKFEEAGKISTKVEDGMAINLLVTLRFVQGHCEVL